MYYLFILFYLSISGDRILVEPRFSAPVQTGPGTHPASYTMGAGLYAGLKRPGCYFNHSPQFSAEVKERVEVISLLPLRAFMADYSLN